MTLPTPHCRSVDLRGYLARQSKFSGRAFGPGRRTKGIVEHIAEECREVVESGHDVRECVDVLILALDLCWRSGASPIEVEAALQQKMAINEARRWPPVGSVSEDRKINHDRGEEAQPE